MKFSRFETVLGLATLLGLGYMVYDYSGFGGESVQGLSGSIRFEGKPLAKGTVRFLSVDAENPKCFGGYVNNGRYEVPAEFGLVPARYVVEFSSIHSDDMERMLKARQRGEDLELKEEIPARYSRNSEVQVDLSSGGVLEVDFDLD
ncbi:hypothetical protein [Paludisphaera soli]|uniref:hypothetical protein n=1 Tax=Paludisphaera soli TaxID=2712865 RepID=UPI0013EBD746|nr:hypothetical protein [Paludisphaera soli]